MGGRPHHISFAKLQSAVTPCPFIEISQPGPVHLTDQRGSEPGLGREPLVEVLLSAHQSIALRPVHLELACNPGKVPQHPAARPGLELRFSPACRLVPPHPSTTAPSVSTSSASQRAGTPAARTAAAIASPTAVSPPVVKASIVEPLPL